MCQECGCSQKGPYRIDGQPAGELVLPSETDPIREHGHPHPHAQAHGHEHDQEHAHRELHLHQPVLAQNDRFAERNRGCFLALGLTVLNVVSSPGSGKTTLLQKTLERLKGKLRAAVIVGDLATDNDAHRLRTTGAPVVQVTTGTLCHLEAEMINNALGRLDLRNLDLLIIENVGNLVCPASFDLGEDTRVALLSVTEGEDKPLKYPPIFHGADVVLVTKSDLATATEFDRDTALANIRKTSPKAQILEVSAKSGAGMTAWCDLLRSFHGRRLPESVTG